MTLINDMILLESDAKKRELLRELKRLNKAAYLIMMQPGKNFKQKYTELQSTPTWFKAKLLLMEYFAHGETIVVCPICNRDNICNDFILHHDKYVNSELFTPKYVMFVHSKCHSHIHYKKFNKKKKKN